MRVISGPWAFPRPYFLLTDDVSSSENLTPLNVFSVACENSNGIRSLFSIEKLN